MTNELEAPQGGDPQAEALRKKIIEKFGDKPAATKPQQQRQVASPAPAAGLEGLREKIVAKFGETPAEAPAPEVPPFLQAPPQQAAAGGASSITPPTTPPAPTPQPAPAGGPDWSKYQGPNTSLPQELKPVVTDGVDDMGDTFLTADTKKNAEAVLFTYRNDFSPQAVRDKAKAKETLEGIEAADAYAKEEMMRVKKEILPQRVNTLRGMEQGFAEDKRAFEEAVAALQAKVPQYQQAVAQDPTQAEAINAQYQQELQGIRSMEDMLKKQASVGDAYAKSVEADRILAEGYDYLLRSRQGTFGGATWNNMLNAVGSSVSGLNAPILSALLAVDPAKPRDGETQEQANARVKKGLLNTLRETPKEELGAAGTTEEYVQKMQDTFLGGAWLAGTGSVTNMLAGGGIGLMTAAADNVRKEMEDESFAGVDDWKKELFSNTVGVVIGQLEKYGIQQAVGGGQIARSILANAFSKLPKNATTAEIKAVIMAETESAAANFVSRVGTAALAEGATEFQQGIIEPAMKDVFNLAEEKNLLVREDGTKGFATPQGVSGYISDALYQAAQGMVIGGVMGTPSAVYKHMQDRSVGKTTNNAQFELTESLLKDKEFLPTMEADLEAKVEAGTITPTQAEETKAAWKEAQTVIAKIPDDLPTDKKREAFDLLTEKQQLSKLDKSMVGDRIMKVDEKLAKVAGVPDVKAETKEWSGKEVEPKAKTSPEPAPAETPAPVAEAEVIAEAPVVKTTQEIQPEDGGQAEAGVGESPLALQGDAMGASAGTGASGNLAGQPTAIGQVDTPVDGGGATAAVDAGPTEGLGATPEVVPEGPAITPEAEQPAKAVKAPKPKAPKKAPAKQAAPKVEEPPAPTPAPKVAEAAKPTATPMSFKREGQAPVTEPVIVTERKDEIGPEGVRGRQREYIYPGLEEYRLITAKVKGGYKVYEATSGAAISKEAQPNEDLALADAAEIIERNGKEKVDNLIAKVLEPKVKLSEKIANLKIDTSKLGGMTFAVPLPVSPKLIAQAINAALDTVAAGVRAAENLSAALGRARNEFQSNDWYKNLDTAGKQRANAVFRDRVARPITALATDQEKPKKSKVQRQANKATGVTKEKNLITVDERVALKEKLRGLSKVASGAARQYRSASKDFAGAVKTAMKPLRAKLGGNKVAAITNAALKVNPTDQLKLERFLQYVDNVITKANYADDLAKARKAQKSAGKLWRNKRIPINHQEALKHLVDVDVSMIEDPLEYAEFTSAYVRSMVSPSAKSYQQQNSQAAIDYANSLYKQEQVERDRMLRDSASAGAGEISPNEVGKALYADDVNQYANKLDDDKRDSLIERIGQMAASSHATINQEVKAGNYSLEALSPREREYVEAFMSANVANMTLQQQVNYTLAVDNALENNSFDGAMAAAAAARVSGTVNKAAKATEGFPVKRFFSSNLRDTMLSVPNTFAFFFGRGGAASKIQVWMGLTQFDAGKTKWTQEVLSLEKKMTLFFEGLGKKYKDAYSAPNMTAEAIASIMIQGFTGVDPKVAVDMRRKAIKSDIKDKMDFRDYKKEAIVAEQVLASFDKAETPEQVLDILKRQYPSAYETVRFLIEASKPFRQVIEQNARMAWNELGDYNDPYYIHIKFRKSPRSKADAPIEGPRSSSLFSTVRPKQAKGTIARERYSRLSNGLIFDYNVRKNTFADIKSKLYDVYTSFEQMQIHEFMRMSKSEQVFGSPENRNFVHQKLNEYLSSEFKDLDTQEKIVGAFASFLRKFAGTRTLGAVAQMPLQAVEAYSKAIIVASKVSKGRSGLEIFGRAMLEQKAADSLTSMFSIGHRAGVASDKRFDGKMSTEEDRLNAAISGGDFAKAVSSYQTANEFFINFLSRGDNNGAKTLWLAAYMAKREEQGHKVLSWDQEAELVMRDEERLQAVTFASDQTDTLLAPSDPAKASALAKRGQGALDLVKAMFFAFSSFAIENATSAWIDMTNIASWTGKFLTGDQSRRNMEVANSLKFRAAAAAGIATYLAASGLRSDMKVAMAEFMNEMFDSEDEDEFLLFTMFVHTFWLAGIMDVDIFRASQAARRTREKARKSGSTYEDYMDSRKERMDETRRKSNYTRFWADFMGLGVSQDGLNFAIEAVNYAEYSRLVDEGDPSIYTKQGKVMDFDAWQKDPLNTPLYRYGQGFDEGPLDLGLIGILLDTNKQIKETGPKYREALESKTPWLFIFSDSKKPSGPIFTGPTMERPE